MRRTSPESTSTSTSTQPTPCVAYSHLVPEPCEPPVPLPPNQPTALRGALCLAAATTVAAHPLSLPGSWGRYGSSEALSVCADRRAWAAKRAIVC